MARAFAIASWLGVALSFGLHVAFWRGLPASAASLGGLALAFGLTAAALFGMILALQAAAQAGRTDQAFFAVVPPAARWLLGLGFLYVAAHLVDYMPVGGRGSHVDVSAFERVFSAIVAWQALVAALYHTHRAPTGHAA